ncbi:MAG: EAL domain-containing protein [Oscillatoriales cyanobacterium]|nr:MAG: EAL domain-containing protein [Oscillatoriales cyanobacterium]
MDYPSLQNVAQWVSLASQLVLQPRSPSADYFLRELGFRRVPQAPQLLSRFVSQGEIEPLFQQLIEGWPDDQVSETRFLITDAPLNSRRLLVEFLSSRPLGMMIQAQQFGWFQSLLDRRLLFFVYQPLVDLRSGHVLGHECLVRGKLDTGETLSGFQLIEAAHTTQMMGALDETARHICLESIRMTLNRSRDRAIDPHTLAEATPTPHCDRNMASLGSYWINIMPNTILHDAYFVENLIATLPFYDLKPQQITLELTEVEKIVDASELAAKVQQLQQAGFAIALDDLYSTVPIENHLLEVMPNYIKLDRRLVHECSQYHVKRIVIESLLQSAHDFGITVLAEGLEAAADIECCRELGVDLGQGFGLGLPAIEPLAIGQPLPNWPFPVMENFPGQDEPKLQGELHCIFLNADHSCSAQEPLPLPTTAGEIVYPQCSLFITQPRARSRRSTPPCPPAVTLPCEHRNGG